MSEMNSENAANNTRNISTWTNIFVPIYFYEEISFQKPFEDREYIIKVIEIDVIAIKAKTESFQVVKLILLIFVLIVCIFP